MTTNQKVLGFDVGGTKTAWGVVNEAGEVLQHGQFPTPQHRDEFLSQILAVMKAHPTVAVGMGIPGTISADHADIVVCPHIPELSHLELLRAIQTNHDLPVAIENDARCALVGEAWQGKAQNGENIVMITLGTGVGGAVMQNGVVLPHPEDINQEISHVVADPSDLLPASTGKGSVESLLGGANLEERFGIPVHELVAQVRAGQPDAVETFKTISYYFMLVIRAIYDTYGCNQILVGGKGGENLDLYLRDIPPCPVEAAALGDMAGIVGAARLGFDLLEKQQTEAAQLEETPAA